MAFASVPNGNNIRNEDKVNEFLSNKTKSMAKVYLYMGIGLLVTALVSLGVGALFAGLFSNFGRVDTADIAENAMVAYVATMVISFIVLLVDGVVIARRAYSSKRSLWAPYIIYAIVMGVFLSSFLIAGIDFYTIGEAFGISALAFFVMALIGYKSKSNLNVLGMIASGFLFCLLLGSLFWGIFYLISPTLVYVFDIVTSFAIMAFIMVMIAVDTYNIKRILANGCEGNVVLYCAYIMYSDFISIFIRILYLLASLKDR